VKYRSMIIICAGIALGVGIGWFLFPYALYSSETQPIQFSHKVHTGEQAGMTCDNCHEFDADGRFLGIPTVEKCAGCHSATLGTSPAEKRLVEEYVPSLKPIPWKVYARQPDNAYFPHAVHAKEAGLGCQDCHGPHGTSDSLRVYQVNRLSGYSRDIWGQNISGFSSRPWEGMKMDRCVRCHEGRGRKDGCIACHK
jgi:menaquinone reductase, multiheme cytochrome c subunit